MRRFAAPAACLLALASLALGGCPTPVEETDAALDARRIRLDAGPEDAGPEQVDAYADDANEDANTDAAFVEPPDAYVEPDASLGPSFDGGPCSNPDDDAATSRCTCLSLGPDCSSASCPTGLACVDDGCGRHCQASGATCAGAADCPSGSTCTMTEVGMACVRAAPGCATSRDCPLGFSCSAGACTDRRIGCTTSDFDTTCPFNFVCNAALGAPFCVRAMPRCEGSGACQAGESCVDVEGDGLDECVGAGLCDATADCAGMGGSCGVEPSRLIAGCLPSGLCETTSDCAGGRTCVDLWGDGQAECVEAGGSCDAQTDCAEGQLCASPYEGGAPRCIDTALSI